MDESILDDVKKLLGITKECTVFDADIIIHVNSVLSLLRQMGMRQFSITGSDEVWSDYIPEGKSLEDIKTYVYLKVKLIFDPPSSSAALESIKALISELEWRITVGAEEIEEVSVNG